MGTTPPALASDRAAGSQSAPVLDFRGITKRFGGTLALDDVHLELRTGEILALLGENGAGKSTLIKILASVYTLDTGSIEFRGHDATSTLRRLPISFIHQDLGLIDWMTVAENICLTLGYPRRGRLIDWRAARQRAATALEVLDADIDPDVRIQSLSRTEKSLVAIARALAAEAEVLVLDEPTASLPADEVARLFVALRRLRDRGVGIIYVSHRLDEVFEIADRMVVLRDGRVAGERRVDQTTPEEVILLIVGREPSQVFRRPPRRMGQPRMALQSVMVGEIGPIDCELHAGEVVGFVGLRGAGQETIGRALFGTVPTTGGRVLLDGKPVAPATPRQAMANGINLVCADRAGEFARTQPDDSGEPLPQPARGRLAPSVAAQSRPREPGSHGAWPAGRTAAERSALAHRASVRRQSTEGRGRSLAAFGQQGLRLRGSDGRCRCRREGGDLSAV